MVFSFTGILCLFVLYFLNFAKLQIPRIECDDLSFPFIWFCLATIGVCVFGALTLVGALFLFKGWLRFALKRFCIKIICNDFTKIKIVKIKY